MSEYFVYNTTPKPVMHPKMSSPPPLFTSKETSDMMAEAKRKNDSTYWETMRKVFALDLENLPMERFKVWASTMNVPIMSRAILSDYVRIVLNEIETNELAAEAVKEPGIGLTEQDYVQVYRVFNDIQTTMNRIQNMGHLAITGWTKNISELDTIVEIGAGAGDLADIVYKLGFKGKYVIYDFPELLEIQKWYHDKLGHKNIQYVSDVNELEAADLCIATWSFTEMPLDLREEVMGRIGETKNWVVAYSNLIFGIDNNKYMTEDFVPHFKDHEVTFIDVPSMPWDGGTKYLSVKTQR